MQFDAVKHEHSVRIPIGWKSRAAAKEFMLKRINAWRGDLRRPRRPRSALHLFGKLNGQTVPRFRVVSNG